MPFLTPSLQAGAWQMLPVHTWLSQSLLAWHALPSPQGLHLPPPQSRSVSKPFFSPSLQAEARHTLPLQTLLAQSSWALQPCPSLHLVAQGPPQSMSPSLTPPGLFKMPSVQVPGWHLPL